MNEQYVVHSSMGGDVVLEHASSNKNPGNYGLKNTGRDRYVGLQQKAEEAARRNADRKITDVLERAKKYSTSNSEDIKTINNSKSFTVIIKADGGKTVYHVSDP